MKFNCSFSAQFLLFTNYMYEIFCKKATVKFIYFLIRKMAHGEKKKNLKLGNTGLM